MVEQTVARLRGHLAALRALVEEAALLIVATPRLDVKAALADRLHDDATSARNVARRIAELGGEDTPTEPDEDLAGALREHIASLDPFVDEPTLRLLTEVLAHQERHRIDGAARAREATTGEPSEDLVPRLIAQRLRIADNAARAIPDAPYERRAVLARRCWDVMRHATALEQIAPWPGAATGPDVDPEQIELPGHEGLLAYIRADDRRARAESV